MKTKYLAIALASLMSAACFTSCSNDELIPEETQTVAKNTCPKVIHVNVEGSTRAYMGEGNKPMWEKVVNAGEPNHTGDMLNVYSLSEEGRLISCMYMCTEPSTGEFTIYTDWRYYSDNSLYTGEPAGPFIVKFGGFSVVLNESEAKSEISTFASSFTKPGELTDAYMACLTDDLNNVTMKNLMALLKVNVPEGSDIKQIDLDFYGYQRAEYDLISNSWCNYGENAKETLSYGYAFYWDEWGGTAASVKTLAPGDYYFPVIPQTLTSTAENPCIELRFTDAAIPYTEKPGDPSLYTVKQKTGTVTFEAGKIYDLGTIGVDF